jgi:uncharacterized protein
MSDKDDSNDQKDLLEPNQPESATEAQVLVYLDNHADFFDFHPELLKRMTLRHGVGASSLLDRQNKQLRDQLQEQERYFDNLILHAKRNELLWHRARQSTLAFLMARNPKHLLEIAKKRISEEFQLPFVGFVMTCMDLSPLAIQISPERSQEILPSVFVDGHATVGAFSENTAEFLAGGRTDLCSFAVSAIHDEQRNILGALVMGHNQVDYFERGEDTLFVDYLGSLLGILLIKLERPFSALSD